MRKTALFIVAMLFATVTYAQTNLPIDAQTKKIPYTVVVGDKELNDAAVSVRRYGDEHTEEELRDPSLIEKLKLRDAEEFFEYNTRRTLPYAHDAAPVIVEGFSVDTEAWDHF